MMDNSGGNGGIKRGSRRRDSRRDAKSKTNGNGAAPPTETVGTLSGRRKVPVRLILAVVSVVLTIIGLGVVLGVGK